MSREILTLKEENVDVFRGNTPPKPDEIKPLRFDVSSNW